MAPVPLRTLGLVRRLLGVAARLRLEPGLGRVARRRRLRRLAPARSFGSRSPRSRRRRFVWRSPRFQPARSPHEPRSWPERSRSPQHGLAMAVRRGTRLRQAHSSEPLQGAGRRSAPDLDRHASARSTELSTRARRIDHARSPRGRARDERRRIEDGRARKWWWLARLWWRRRRFVWWKRSRCAPLRSFARRAFARAVDLSAVPDLSAARRVAFAGIYGRHARPRPRARSHGGAAGTLAPELW
jgi:hypothetical protein